MSDARGGVPRNSAKQLKMFAPTLRKEGGLDGCPRKWGFCYVDRLKADKGPALIDGIKLHHCMASLIKCGRLPQPGPIDQGVVLTAEDVKPEGHFGKMSRKLLPLLPERPGGPPVQWTPEAVYTLPWVTANGTSVELDIRPDVHSDAIGPAYFIDWKSTSDRKYALKSLEEELQAHLYAFGLMKKLGCFQITALWNYVNKTNYRAWSVRGVFDRGSEDWLHAHIDKALDLIPILRAEGITGAQLPRDLGACEGIGKFCDYAGHCFNLPKGQPSVISLEEINSFLRAA